MVWNIPNVLSLSRIFFTPFIIWMIVAGYEKAFVYVFIAFQFTDVLDGFIARRFNMRTPIGALLDSYGDVCSYVIALTAICFFHHDLLEGSNLIFCCIFLGFYLCAMAISKLKFGQWVYGLHLVSAKVTFIVQSLFIVVLFAYGMVLLLFYAAFVVGIYTEAETMLIYLSVKEPAPDMKSYWKLKNKGLV